MTGRRVVVTGLGPVTSIGTGAHDFHRAQLKGVSGIRAVTRFDASDLPVRIAGEVDLPAEFAPTRRELLATDRCGHLAATAAALALADSGLDLKEEDHTRIGVVVGSGSGGSASLENGVTAMLAGGPRKLPPRLIPMAMVNSPAAHVALKHGLLGPCSAISTACASGAEALVAAHQMIASGEADVVLAGGAEAPLTSLVLGGFARMGALSLRNHEPEGASRPFDSARDGFVLAEGAALLVLESAEHASARGATILAELRGYGRSADAHHITAPHPEGVGAGRAVTAALRSASLRPEDVSYVNAHGTGTAFNDASEARALHRALGAAAGCVPVSATKSMTGHALGAAGAIEAVASVQALVHGVVPPTLNLDSPDPAVGLDLVTDAPREGRITSVLSNSFAFGGHNVVLAFTSV
ncbi:beta-ketoacyl-ACP synthase II [Streptomyces sp. NPDC058548]|uniref:beta-ketoacyl-ACP synthase II n=1 Tax=unclassified Streptomyces TaxID=2593676 RepID=UPI00366545C8